MRIKCQWQCGWNVDLTGMECVEKAVRAGMWGKNDNKNSNFMEEWKTLQGSIHQRVEIQLLVFQQCNTIRWKVSQRKMRLSMYLIVTNLWINVTWKLLVSTVRCEWDFGSDLSPGLLWSRVIQLRDSHIFGLIFTFYGISWHRFRFAWISLPMAKTKGVDTSASKSFENPQHSENSFTCFLVCLQFSLRAQILVMHKFCVSWLLEKVSRAMWDRGIRCLPSKLSGVYSHSKKSDVQCFYNSTSNIHQRPKNTA